METPGTQTAEGIRQKRAQTLLGVWDLLREQNHNYAGFKLAPPLVNEVVEQYLDDRRILMSRYHIPSRIQPPKIAGLMMAAVLRYRPVVPVIEEYTSPADLFTNETLAIYNGLAICAEHAAGEALAGFVGEQWFDPWLRNFRYLLHFRHHTAESLTFVFETLCHLRFPQAVAKGED